MYGLKIYWGVLCHDNEEWCKIGRWIWEILTRALKNLKYLHFKRLLLTKVYNVRAKKSIEELYLMALKIDAKFEGELTCAS